MSSSDKIQNSGSNPSNDKESIQHVDEVIAVEEEKIVVAPEMLKKLLRKLDLRLLPVLCALYLMAYLDRCVQSRSNSSGIKDFTDSVISSNIGNAKLGGLIEDTNTTTFQYQWCLSVFYFGYILFDIPANIILRRWRASYWLAFITL